MKPPNNVTPARNAAQPGISSTSKIYGAKRLPTVRVRLKKGKAKRVLMIINEKDFDEKLYVKVE